MRTVGIDVGGTKVLGVLVDSDDPATVVAERRVPTPEGGQGLIETLADVVATLTVEAGQPAAVGVGVPGLVDRT
ncbi:MAG: ROK family protein, partial [Acidimicrobiales bacterium]